MGVAVLLDVRGHHEYRFAQIHRLTHRLKPCRSGVGAASRERLEERLVVYLVERKGGVDLIYLVNALPVPEEIERHTGIVTVPPRYALTVTRIDHVTVNIVTVRRSGVEHLAAEQRRHHAHVLPAVVRHASERQGELVLSAYTRDAREHTQEEEAHRASLRKLETAVQEKILMSYAHLRDLRTEQKIGESGEQLVEVHHEVCLCLYYPAAYKENALHVSRSLEDVVCHAAREVAALV